MTCRFRARVNRGVEVRAEIRTQVAGQGQARDSGPGDAVRRPAGLTGAGSRVSSASAQDMNQANTSIGPGRLSGTVTDPTSEEDE